MPDYKKEQELFEENKSKFLVFNAQSGSRFLDDEYVQNFLLSSNKRIAQQVVEKVKDKLKELRHEGYYHYARNKEDGEVYVSKNDLEEFLNTLQD